MKPTASNGQQRVLLMAGTAMVFKRKPFSQEDITHMGLFLFIVSFSGLLFWAKEKLAEYI